MSKEDKGIMSEARKMMIKELIQYAGGTECSFDDFCNVVIKVFPLTSLEKSCISIIEDLEKKEVILIEGNIIKIKEVL